MRFNHSLSSESQGRQYSSKGDNSPCLSSSLGVNWAIWVKNIFSGGYLLINPYTCRHQVYLCWVLNMFNSR